MSTVIETITTYAVRVPLARPLQIGAMHIREREYVVVEVSAEGETGRFFGHSRNAPVAETVAACVAPHYLGQPVADHAACHRTAAKVNVCLGTNGVFWRALSLVDCAVHDLAARLAGRPLCVHLGGERKSTPTLMVGGYPGPDETPESLQDQMRLFSKHRPAGVKIASSTDLPRDTRRLRACREALSEDIPLMMDFFWSFDEADPLIREAASWRELNMGWVEDPFAFDDYASMAVFQQALSIPLAVGDEQSGDRAFVRLMDTGRVRVPKIDATVCGGVTAFLRICREAESRGLSVATHVFHPLHAHLAGVAGNVRWLETIPPETNIEAVHTLWTHDIKWSNGGYLPPDTPGIGISWDEEALARYRIP